jgi:hypothetical protein
MAMVPSKGKEIGMRRLLMFLLGLALLTGTMAAPAGAITGGRPDGTAHPYVGIVMALTERSARACCWLLACS